MEPGNQEGQIPYGQGIDNLVSNGHRFGCCLRCCCCGSRKGSGDPCEVGHQQNQASRNGGCQYEDDQGVANHFSYFPSIFGVGNGAGDGEENQRDDETEQQVQENLPDGFQE